VRKDSSETVYAPRVKNVRKKSRLLRKAACALFLAADAAQHFTVVGHALDEILLDRHGFSSKSVVDMLQILAAAIHSQLDIFTVVDHCFFLLDMG